MDTLESIWGPPKKEEGYDEQQIAKRLLGAGLKPHAVAGVLGNLQQESGFKTDAKGDNGASIGLAQWQGPRRKALEAFQGDQVDFLLHELSTDYKHVLEKINSAGSPEEAAQHFSDLYERPSKKHANNEGRKSWARKFYDSVVYQLSPGQAEAAGMPEQAAATTPKALPTDLGSVWGNEEPQAQPQPEQSQLAIPTNKMQDIWGTQKPGELMTIISKDDINDPEGRSWGDVAKDMALIGAAGVVASTAVGLTPLTGGASVVAGGALAGALYGGAKELTDIGGKPEGSMILPDTPAGRITEDALIFGALDVAARPAMAALKKGAKLFEPIGEKAWDVMKIIPEKIPTGGGMSLTERLQPAIERLREKAPNVAASFRKARTMQSLTKEEGVKLAQEAEGLNFTERSELMKALGGHETEGLSPKVQEIVSRYEGKLGQTTEGRYQEAFVGKLSQLATKRLTISGEPELEAAATRHLDSLLTGEKLSVKQMRGALSELIEDGSISDEVKAYARDLYDLPAQLPIDIARSSNYATTEHIIHKLLKNPGVVSREAKEGYVKSEHPSIKGLFVAKDVELELQAMRKLEKEGSNWYRKWFLTPWKTAKVVMRPAAHAAHIVGRMVLNDWGGLPFYRWDIYKDALKGMYDNSSSFQRFKSISGMGHAFSTEEIGQLHRALKYGASVPEKLLNLFNHVAAPGRAMYSAQESWFKYAKFLHNIEQGMRPTDATLDALKWTFNWGEITPFIRTVRNSPVGIPFVTFQSKALPLLAETAVKHPLRFGKWLGLGNLMMGYSLDKLGMSHDEWEQLNSIMPDRLKGGLHLPMPYRGDDGALRIMDFGWLIPGLREVGYLNSYGWASPLVQSPVVSTAATLASRRLHTGVPLYYDWEEPTTKAAKTMKFLWQMWSPSLAPGNYDWQTLHDAMEERPEALSPYEAIAAQFGLRLTPVDVGAAYKRHKALQKIHEAEASTQMRQQLRRSGSGEETEDIIRRWQEGVQSIRQGQ